MFDVPGRIVGAVEDDADPGPPVTVRLIGGGLRPRQLTPHRHLLHGFEGVTGEQDGVGEEGVHVAEIPHPALHEVVVGLCCDTHRYAGELHQRGVGGVLATEHHQW